MADRDEVVAAIEASWSRQTSWTPSEWDESNPAKGHCDVASMVAWEHLGGDVVQGEVHVDGAFQEFHYWNRLDGGDLDLTRDQFRGDEVITEVRTLSAEFLTANRTAMKPEVRARIAAFRDLVAAHLGAGRGDEQPSLHSPSDDSDQP